MSNRVRFLSAASIILLFIAYAAEPDAFERGMAAFRKRDFPAAESELTKVVREHPSSARAWKLLGMVYSSQDKYELAEGPLRRACQIDAQEENACYYLGRLYFTVSRLAESLDSYSKAPLNGRVLLGRALTLEAMSRPGEAELDYKRAIAGGETRASIDYGLFLFKQGRGAESLAVLRKAGAQAEADRVAKA
ncbi:MAG: tetratricopeptide repeat protein, partial [Acidobacteriota bacterium]|nr:tetratricopeptide repeat protein [Acidobacteriota bacterium]